MKLNQKGIQLVQALTKPLPTKEKSEVSVNKKRFEDYVSKLPHSIDHTQPTSHQVSSTMHPLTHYSSYDKFTNNQKDFLSAISLSDEPIHYKQAVKMKTMSPP